VADEVIVPMQPQFLPLQGMAKLLETVQLVNRRMNPALKVSGDRADDVRQPDEAEQRGGRGAERVHRGRKGKPLPWSEARLFRRRSGGTSSWPRAPSFGQNILKYDPASNGAADYRNLAKEVVAMSEPPVVEAAPEAQAPEATGPAGTAGVTDPAPAAGAGAAPAEGGAGPSVQVNRAVDPNHLAAAKADLEAAKAEIAAAARGSRRRRRSRRRPRSMRRRATRKRWRDAGGGITGGGRRPAGNGHRRLTEASKPRKRLGVLRGTPDQCSLTWRALTT
jgi:hypothetical protein